MKLNHFMCVFFCFFFQNPLKDFPFHFILFTLRFRYLQTLIKESCVYISSQIFCKTLQKTLKFQEKSKKNTFSSSLETKMSKVFHSVVNSANSKETESLGENGCRQKCLDKSLLNKKNICF